MAEIEIQEIVRLDEKIIREMLKKALNREIKSIMFCKDYITARLK